MSERPRRRDGVSATSRHRDAIDATARESTDRVERPRRAAQVPSLKKKINLVREKLDDPIIASVFEKPSTVLSFLESNQESLDDLRKRSETLADYQVALGLDVDEYDTLDEVQLDLTLKLKLWRGVKEWSQLTAGWVVQALLDVDAAEMEKQVNLYTKTVFQAQKGMPGNPVVPRLKDSVDTFTPLLPCVVNLRNNNLQERHWDEIHSLLGFEVKGDKNFTLGDLVNEGVTAHADAITVIATNATQESVLEEMMAKACVPCCFHAIDARRLWSEFEPLEDVGVGFRGCWRSVCAVAALIAGHAGRGGLGGDGARRHALQGRERLVHPRRRVRAHRCLRRVASHGEHGTG